MIGGGAEVGEGCIMRSIVFYAPYPVLFRGSNRDERDVIGM